MFVRVLLDLSWLPREKKAKLFKRAGFKALEAAPVGSNCCLAVFLARWMRRVLHSISAPRLFYAVLATGSTLLNSVRCRIL